MSDTTDGKYFDAITKNSSGNSTSKLMLFYRHRPVFNSDILAFVARSSFFSILPLNVLVLFRSIK